MRGVLFILNSLNCDHNPNLFGRIMITVMVKIMSKHHEGIKYALTDERRYLRFSARVNESADGLLKIQMTNFFNFDGLVKSLQDRQYRAGLISLDFRGNDENGSVIFYGFANFRHSTEFTQQ